MEKVPVLWSSASSGYDGYFLDCVLPTFSSVIVYAILNLPYLTLDLFGCPKALLKYKLLQPKNTAALTYGHVWKTLRTTVFNMVVVGFCFFNFIYVLRKWRGCKVGPELPTLFNFITHIVICMVVSEFCFYYGHRALHSSLLYKRIHKKHHEWKIPISITSIYCHPLEHFFVNLTAVCMGPVVAKADTFTSSLWYFIQFLITTCHHSGYDFPLLPSPRFHDHHHESFNECFGGYGILDYLHGTDTTYRKKINERSKN